MQNRNKTNMRWYTVEVPMSTNQVSFHGEYLYIEIPTVAQKGQVG